MVGLVSVVSPINSPFLHHDLSPVTRRVPPAAWEVLPTPDHLSSPSIFSWIRGT